MKEIIIKFGVIVFLMMIFFVSPTISKYAYSYNFNAMQLTYNSQK